MGDPSITTSSLVASPSTLTADGVSTSTLTLTVLDANGNPLSDDTVYFTEDGSGTFTYPAGQTDANGQFTATLSSSVAEIDNISAYAANAAGGNTRVAALPVTFVPGPPSLETSTVFAYPNNLTVDGQTDAAVTVILADANNNKIANAFVTLAASGVDNTFGAISGYTDSHGEFTTTISSRVAQTETITATENGYIQEFTPITFLPGAVSAATSSLVASPSQVTADGASYTALTITALDAWGNPVSGAVVSLSGSGPSNDFSFPNGVTDSNGKYVTILASSVAESELITATIGVGSSAISESAPVAFVAGPVSQSTSSLVASPANLTADGAQQTNLTLIAEDALGNPEVGQTVSLTASGSDNMFGQATGVTNALGEFTTTLSSTLEQTESVTATIAGADTESAFVTFNAGPVSGANSYIAASSSTLVADGVNSSDIAIYLKDANGNPVSDQMVTFSSSGLGDTFITNSGITNSQGEFTAALTSTTAGVDTITATAGDSTETLTISVLPGAPSDARSVISASPSTVVADGVQTANLSVLVEDQFGNPIANQTVSLSANGADNTFGATAGSTNAQGIFTTTLSSTSDQVETVTATEGTTHESTVVDFVGGAPHAPTLSSVVGQPVNGDKVEISGNGVTAGDTITLYNGADAVGSGPVSSDGSFDITTTTPFDDGDYTITATETTPQNVTSPVSSGLALSVDPSTPTSLAVIGQPVNNGTIAVAGKGETGDTITLYADGSSAAVGTGIVVGGSFNITTTKTFIAGSHTISAVEVDPANLSSAPTALLVASVDYLLTTKKDVIIGGSSPVTILAAKGTLSAGDVIAPTIGANILSLVGGGAFNLKAPATLTNLATLNLQEEASAPVQTVTLRSGLNLTVNVASLLGGKISIVGAANNDVINLGSGTDTVTLGSASESVHGGGGVAIVKATSSSAGALITGNSGTTTLEISGGGVASLNSEDTGVTTVDLEAASAGYDFTANNEAGLVIDDFSKGTDTIEAGGTGQTLTGGPTGGLKMYGFGSGITTYKDTTTAFNYGDSIHNFSEEDLIDITNWKFGPTTKLTVTNAAPGEDILTIKSNNIVKANITVFGQFASFMVGSDGAGGTLITDPPLSTRSSVSPLASSEHHISTLSRYA